MIDTESLTAEERDLRSGLLHAARSAQLGGSGKTALHPPSPHVVLAAGRRSRARRRAGAVSMLTAAALAVTVAGVGAGAGAFTLPWLRADGATGPSALFASPGTRVGDVVNALDPNFYGVDAAEGSDLRPDTWYYDTGEAASSQTLDDPLLEANASRRVDLRRSGPEAKPVYTFTLTNLTNGDSPKSGTLGTLSTGDDGRGQWRRVRPSAEDGWLVLAVLPPGASAVQVRVTGTDVLLPLSQQVVEEEAACISTDESPDAVFECAGKVTPPTVQFRLATTDPAPPIDAITYISKDGRFVTLAAEALVR
jgi:hypothetical protein